MLDLALIFIFVISFFIGLRRGFILQMIYFAGFIIALITAYIYYDELAEKLKSYGFLIHQKIR